MKDRVRVLVVDDSAFARKVISNVLNAQRNIEVVGTARDGLEALERITELAPDVVTLDLVMPHLDGVGVLQARVGQAEPRFVVVSMSDSESDLGAAALQAGAIDLVHKPTAMATERLYELGDELVHKVLTAAQASPSPILDIDVPPRASPKPGQGPGQAVPVVPAASDPLPRGRLQSTPDLLTRLVVLGASTGGPQALARLLPALPGDLPCPLVVALHIPEGYTAALARRLDAASALQVVEASDSMVLKAGVAAIAPGGRHLRIANRDGVPVTEVSDEPRGTLHRPSVNTLFTSAAESFGGSVLAVVLTGMGDDGLLGAEQLVRRGGRVLTEAAVSCVVHGMPRCVLDAGLSAADIPLDRMARAIVDQI